MSRLLTRSRARIQRIERGFAIVAHAIIALYALFVLFHWMSEQPFFRLTSVEVRGARAVDPDEISARARRAIGGTLVYLWVHKDNALLYPSRDVERDVRALSGWIKTAQVHAGRTTVHVTVSEYFPAFLWCSDEQLSTGPLPPEVCWYTDERGRIFVRAPEIDGYLFVRIIGTNQGTSTSEGTYIMDPEEFARLVDFMRALERMGFRVRSVTHLTENDYRVRTDRSWDILWQSTDGVAGAIHKLSLALSAIEAEEENSRHTIKEVDLRFGDKVFTR